MRTEERKAHLAPHNCYMENTHAYFGPAGNPERFYAEGNKRTVQMMKWLAEQGLDAYEYSAGNGVNGSEETFRAIGAEAKAYGIRTSFHTPYYISLTNLSPEAQEKNIGYIKKSIAMAELMEADVIVIHTGSVMKLDRADAMRHNRTSVCNILEAVGEPSVRIGLETMGKKNQLGTLDEVIALCRMDPRLCPVVDFGHLNARDGGVFRTADDYTRVFDRIGEALGDRYARNLHCHFSKIEYTAAGEKRHLTFADTVYGPPFEPLMEAIVRDALCPKIVCESDGTMADDALAMKRCYDSLREA